MKEPWQTKIVRVDPNLDSAWVSQAAAFIRAGELVALPTETVYGLAADAINGSAVAKIFEAKQRPADNPLIVHVSDLAMLQRYCIETDPRVALLADAFWPGPLTLVLKAIPELKHTVGRGLDSVAIRIPDHPVALALIKAAGCGLAAPSANISGKPSPTTAAHVMGDLKGRIPLILDGGPCRLGIESTVLSLTGPQANLLRPGLISAQMIAEVLGELPKIPHQKARHASPGTRYRHYSPQASVFLLDKSINRSSFLALVENLKCRGPVGYLGSRKINNWPDPSLVSRVETSVELAACLYATFRQFDGREATSIIVDSADIQMGAGLLDRLARAANIHFHSPADLESWLEDNPTEAT